MERCNTIRGAAWIQFGRSRELESRGCILFSNLAKNPINIKMIGNKYAPNTGKKKGRSYFFTVLKTAQKAWSFVVIGHGEFFERITHGSDYEV